MSIGIDDSDLNGPSGFGKSGSARHVAARLGLRYLDTGVNYNHTTGEARNSDRGQIALWRVDADSNEESFPVRHSCFTGGNDPYKRLRTQALKFKSTPTPGTRSTELFPGLALSRLQERLAQESSATTATKSSRCSR